jgi:hypothetical protein
MDANGIRMVYGNLHVEHPKKCNPRRPILAAATCEGFSGTGRSVPNLLRGLTRGEIMEKLVIKIVVRFQSS